MKSRKSTDITKAYQACYRRLTKKGFTAELIRLDNEVSIELIKAIKADKLDYQIVPPNDHRTNPTEGAIEHGDVERLGRLARAGNNCHAPAAPAA